MFNIYQQMHKIIDMSIINDKIHGVYDIKKWIYYILIKTKRNQT
jgi:hypothetical protein